MKRIILSVILVSCCAVGVCADRRPVIGISDTYKDASSATVPRTYVNAVLMNGGIPVVIPLMNDETEIIELLSSLDGIIFTGGEDFDPAYYRERPIPQMGKVNVERDRFDLKLVRLASERGIPILGICRGIQLINIAFGGSLYQDLPAQYFDKSISHRQKQPNDEASHSVIVEDNTVFSDIVKDRMLMVNSSHHQAIKDVAKGFRVAGKSSDKLIEVIEKIDGDNWILGVQFHPEIRVSKDLAMRRIFQRFINEAATLESPNRTDKPLIATRLPVEREPLQEPLYNRPTSTPAPQVIYKTVIDTQYIYKTVRDTYYVHVPPDKHYIHVPPDTLYVQVPPDKHYIHLPSDTVYISVPKVEYIYIRDTVYLTHTDVPSITPSIAEIDKPQPTKTKEKPVNEDNIIIPVAETKTPKFVQSTDAPVKEAVDFVTDTLIFTPGVVVSPPATKKNDISKSKKNSDEKAILKKEKKEAEKQAEQKRKEMIEQARQKEKEKKEKEKFEKKFAEAKEKQFQKQQKENAKLDKQELKASKKKEKEQQKNK